MIDLGRRDGRPLRIGHRGAAAIAPENTLAAFRAAVALGVDLIELDVIDLPGGPLVVAHSERLEEVSHGTATGTIRGLTLTELRDVAPGLPTLDDALAFFVDEAASVGVHLDLKLRTRHDELVDAVERHGLAERTVVSSFDVSTLQTVRARTDRIRIGLTYPRDRLGVARVGAAARLGLWALRTQLPRRIPRMLREAEASALMLQHRLVTPETVSAAHTAGAAVLAWTVDTPADIARVVAAGVDGVITNDPGVLMATLRS